LLRQGELEQPLPIYRGTRRSGSNTWCGSVLPLTCVWTQHRKGSDGVLPPIGEVYVNVIWDEITDGQTEIALKVWDRLVAIHPRLPLRDVFLLLLLEK